MTIIASIMLAIVPMYITAIMLAIVPVMTAVMIAIVPMASMMMRLVATLQMSIGIQHAHNMTLIALTPRP